MARLGKGAFTVSTWFDKAGVLRAVNQAKMERLAKCAMLVEFEAKTGMKAGGGAPRKHKTGRPREYWNAMRHGYVTASEPGKPPHRQIGNLVNSIHSAATWAMTYVVGPTLMAWYGRVHEFGTHPFMRPALINAMRRFPMLFKGLKVANTSAGRGLNSRRPRG